MKEFKRNVRPISERDIIIYVDSPKTYINPRRSSDTADVCNGIGVVLDNEVVDKDHVLVLDGTLCGSKFVIHTTLYDTLNVKIIDKKDIVYRIGKVDYPKTVDSMFDGMRVAVASADYLGDSKVFGTTSPLKTDPYEDTPSKKIDPEITFKASGAHEKMDLPFDPEDLVKAIEDLCKKNGRDISGISIKAVPEEEFVENMKQLLDDYCEEDEDDDNDGCEDTYCEDCECDRCSCKPDEEDENEECDEDESPAFIPSGNHVLIKVSDDITELHDAIEEAIERLTAHAEPLDENSNSPFSIIDIAVKHAIRDVARERANDRRNQVEEAMSHPTELLDESNSPFGTAVNDAIEQIRHGIARTRANNRKRQAEESIKKSANTNAKKETKSVNNNKKEKKNETDKK